MSPGSVKWQWWLTVAVLLFFGLVFVHSSPTPEKTVTDRQGGLWIVMTEKVAGWTDAVKSGALANSLSEISPIEIDTEPQKTTETSSLEMSPWGLNLFSASEQIEGVIWPLIMIMGSIMSVTGILALRSYFRGDR